MPEYIDRTAAITSPLWATDLCPAAVLSRLPSADVAPVVHGKWEYEPETINTYAVLKCSECGWWTLDLSIDRAYHYCPNCGARCDR